MLCLVATSHSLVPPYRDGLERVEVDNAATVQQLKQKISNTLNIPAEEIVLSKDSKLLMTKEPEQFTDLVGIHKRLSQAGVQHGDLLFMHYPFERTVAPVVKKTIFDGALRKMTVEQLIAKQTRIESLQKMAVEQLFAKQSFIERASKALTCCQAGLTNRQDAPHCASVSFDRHAANSFQAYNQQALAFSIKRGGILYGNKDEEGNVQVHAIFEPQQEGSAEHLQMQRGSEEEARADFIARGLGMEKVGWIFTQSSKERDYIMHTQEICQMAQWQHELGEHCVTGVVTLESGDEGSQVHFEAFQVSDKCVQLVQDGWFNPSAEPSGVSIMTNPKEPKQKLPVIVAGKDVKEVDNDYFLIPIKILDHEGPLQTDFAIENRLTPQGQQQLKEYMSKTQSKPYWQRLADFHLLLYLSKQAGLDLRNDIAILLECIKHKAQVPDGYPLIIDSMAGL